MGTRSSYSALEMKQVDVAQQQAEVKLIQAKTNLLNWVLIAMAFCILCGLGVVLVYSIRLGQTIWQMDTVPLPPMLGG